MLLVLFMLLMLAHDAHNVHAAHAAHAAMRGRTKHCAAEAPPVHSELLLVRPAAMVIELACLCIALQLVQ